MQKKYKEVNAKIIDRYLNFIEELYAEDRAQLWLNIQHFKIWD